MTTMKSAMVALGSAALVLTASGSTHALGTAARTSYLTFSGPVALPGIELAAGTYIFERIDSNAPDVVHVTTRDRRKSLFLGFTRTVSRPRSLNAEKPAVTLGEARRGVAPPITAWYPAGELIGHEFVYDR